MSAAVEKHKLRLDIHISLCDLQPPEAFSKPILSWTWHKYKSNEKYLDIGLHDCSWVIQQPI